MEWLLTGNKISPEHLVELGCGTGAVLGELRYRKLAMHYYGVDYSAEAIRYLKSTLPDVQCVAADISKNGCLFDRDSFDVVVCSHVIEHMEEPTAFLRSLRRFRFDYLVAEVPLEDLAFGRMKARFNDRSKDPAGHVQFYTRCSFLRLLRSAGYMVVYERIYAPFIDKATIRFAYGGKGRLRYLHKLLTEHHLPRLAPGWWLRWYHAHFAVLCQGSG